MARIFRVTPPLTGAGGVSDGISEKIRLRDFGSRRHCTVVRFFFLLGITCPIKFVTGVSCAGCGMTRAWLHALRLDLSAAFSYHPLFWTVPVAAVFYALRNRLPRRLFQTAVGAAAALFIVVYLIRMFDPNCDIVVFEPRNSVFYSIVRKLRDFTGFCVTSLIGA